MGDAGLRRGLRHDCEARTPGSVDMDVMAPKGQGAGRVVLHHMQEPQHVVSNTWECGGPAGLEPLCTRALSTKRSQPSSSPIQSRSCTTLGFFPSSLLPCFPASPFPPSLLPFFPSSLLPPSLTRRELLCKRRAPYPGLSVWGSHGGKLMRIRIFIYLPPKAGFNWRGPARR